jgi:3-oxoacyl-[acyl-carrier-protein] synthase III
MGTIIKASYASQDGPQSSIGMAAFAAQNCLKQAGMQMQDIDLLINIGVFRDDNIIDPAMAHLIQKKIGMNLDPVKNDHIQRSTLSFDINDGECGFLTAVSVADAFFKSGASKYALIVSGDIHPSKTNHPDFPFQSVATAVLLARSEDDKQGFISFHFKTSSNDSYGFSANVDLMANGVKSRECMEFIIEDKYHDKLSGFTSELMSEVFQSGAINPADIDYIVTSQQTKGFGDIIARSLSLNGRSQVVDLYDRYGDSHTSSLALCYHHLVRGGLVKKNDHILFIAAGSGLSAACSLYIA